jgi:hypothetical protein
MTRREVDAFRAAELRMVAGLFEARGEKGEADRILDLALEIDLPVGNC